MLIAVLVAGEFGVAQMVNVASDVHADVDQIGSRQ